MLFSLIFCFSSFTYLEKRTEYIENNLDECYSLSENNQIYGAKEIYTEILTYWRRERTVLGVFVNGEAFGDFEDSLEILGFSLEKNDTEKAMDAVMDCKEYLKQIKAKEKLTIESIL